MAGSELLSTIGTAIALLRDYQRVVGQCADPNRRFSPTDRARGREARSRQDQAEAARIAGELQHLSEPIADAMERAGIDSTGWLKFTVRLPECPDAECVSAFLLRLQRRVRLGLMQSTSSPPAKARAAPDC